MLNLLGHFDSKIVKLVGAFLFVFLLGYAAGNGHKTQEALDGSAKWWQQKEHQDVKAVAKHQQEKDFGIAK